jgi:hypothetical protein
LRRPFLPGPRGRAAIKVRKSHFMLDNPDSMCYQKPFCTIRIKDRHRGGGANMLLGGNGAGDPLFRRCSLADIALFSR